ncbi:MAG: hypothetical protein R3C58_01620 [Parvularculaceae bacterium]
MYIDRRFNSAGGSGGVAIDEERVAILHNKEIEEDFSLRRQKRGKDRGRGVQRIDILRHDALQKGEAVFASKADDGAAGKELGHKSAR